jgi:hypothetical protein
MAGCTNLRLADRVAWYAVPVTVAVSAKVHISSWNARMQQVVRAAYADRRPMVATSGRHARLAHAAIDAADLSPRVPNHAHAGGTLVQNKADYSGPQPSLIPGSTSNIHVKGLVP